MTASTLRQVLALCFLGLVACQTSNHAGDDAHPVPLTDSAVETGVVVPLASFTQVFPSPAPVIAPLPVEQSVVESVEPNLWRDLRDGFTLDHHTEQKRVRQELAWLQRNPQYLQRLQPRLERHLAYIHKQVRARDFPSEIALLPIIESALDPYAFSPGGAAGLWQFIPATAKRFGLERNWWYDGRRDPVAATEAALDYLARLHKRFGDWSLALAGYNAGEGNVNRALRRSAEGASFWELKLPRETAAYVPRLLALAELVSHPKQFGIELPVVSPEVPFIVVDTAGQLDLSVAAAATGVDIATLYLWNPALNQWATPPKGPHHLLIPTTHADLAQAKLAAIPDAERVQWLRIEVTSGDTLSQIAQRYRTDVASLRKANQLSGNTIRAGHSLLIPKSDAALSNPVAQRSTGRTYIVKSGDSLWSISRAEKVAMAKLMKANHVGPKDTLRIGQRLTLPGGTNSVIRTVHYGVRRGDSLAKIAQKFNVAVNEIADWNHLNPRDYLQPGQSLMLYVDVAAGQ